MPQQTTQTIVAQFDDRASADEAVRALAEAGIARDRIRLMPETGTSYRRTGSSYDRARDEGGFWASLKDLFLPDEDRYAYAEAMSRGAMTVVVAAEQGQVARACEIVERHGAIDLDEREAAWRKEGWTGYSAGAATATRGAAGTGAARDDAEVIPVVEERLNIGKRQVNEGRVRVRAYVVETPVQEQVTLRDETVHVERRAVNRPVTDADRLFQERTIEAESRREEAVVSKEARVKEELVIDKDVRTRTETVQDTVRRTEVEVEDERGQVKGSTGTANRR